MRVKRCIALCICVLMVVTMLPRVVQAQSIDSLDVMSAKQTIEMVEGELSESNSSVIRELENMKAYYLELLRLGSCEDSESIKDLIDSLDNQIIEYKKFEIQRLCNNDLCESKIEVAYCRTAVSAIIAVFNNKGYTLAAELLNKARINKNRNIVYDPINGRRIIHTRTFKNKMKGPDGAYGAEFPNSGSVYDKDLYFSIHACSYSKSGANIIFSDIYDYARSSKKTIEGYAINTMVEAQKCGVITPYHVRIMIMNSPIH